MALTVSTVEPDGDRDLVGSYRRIGRLGPVYEVLSVDDGGMAEILMVESGRTEHYSVEEIRADPVPT